MEAFYWNYTGGRWDDPATWRMMDYNPAQRSAGQAIAPATRAPGAADIVVIGDGWLVPGMPDTRGPLVGGGSAAALYADSDAIPITLADDGIGGPDVYHIGALHLQDRTLSLTGSVLDGGDVTLDPHARLVLSGAGEVSNAAGQSYSARFDSLTLPGGSIPVAQLVLGTHNVLAGTFVNEKGGRTGISGSGEILNPLPDPLPGPAPAPQAPLPLLAVDTRIAIHHELTGDWSDPGPSWQPADLPHIQAWMQLAAAAVAHQQATGHWFA